MTVGSSPIRVGYVIDDLGYAGAQKQLYLLTKALAPHVSARVYCMSERSQPYGDRMREAGVAVTVIPRRQRVPAQRIVPLVRALRRDGVDVVHGFLDASDVYAFWAAWRLRKPAALSLRTDRVRLSGFRAGILKSLLRRADAVTTNSQAARRHAIDVCGVSENRTVYVPNIAPPELLDKPARPAPATPTIGFVGRIAGYKRVDLLVNAFSQLRQSRPDARLLLVGDGQARDSIAAMVERESLDGCVEMPGAVDDVWPFLERLSCLVIPSSSEGVSNVALEALSIGVPVVATPSGDLERIVLEGRTGVLTRDISPAGLRAAIEQALADERMRGVVHREGHLLLREQFGEEQAVSSLLELYTRLCAPRAA